ncbi:MAG: Mov34/MPN/PAD-1 family protein [Candidatus Micrarchaeota archaeon]
MALEVYMKQTAVQKAEEYFSQLASLHLEGMGLLMGEVCEHKGKNFVVVNEFITSETDSSAVSVRFSPNAFEKIAEELQKSGEIVVGWCHSHPGYGCFLSTTDVSTQRRFFNEQFHVAAVFDPLASDDFGAGKVMAKRFYRLAGNSYGEVSFAVIK